MLEGLNEFQKRVAEKATNNGADPILCIYAVYAIAKTKRKLGGSLENTEAYFDAITNEYAKMLSAVASDKHPGYELSDDHFKELIENHPALTQNLSEISYTEPINTRHFYADREAWKRVLEFGEKRNIDLFHFTLHVFAEELEELG